MHVAIAGSSGLIGTALVGALEAAGHRVSRLVRPGAPLGPGIHWDPAAGTIDSEALERVDAVVNLAGRSIGARRWNEAEKLRLRSSRMDSTRLLAEALAALGRPPAVLVSASAVGIYGDRGDEVLTEDSATGGGFFADLCREWESATGPAAAAEIRVVCLRTGIVLSEQGGALARLLAPLGPRWISPYRWGLGGWIGDGRQWWSWISLKDTVRAIEHLIGSSVAGPVNLTAPEPVTNREFMDAVGRALRRPVRFPIPRFVLSAVLGSELAEATLFDGQRAMPSRLLDDGFGFADSDAGRAIREALAR